MKKIVFGIVLLLSFVSCNKTTVQKNSEGVQNEIVSVPVIQDNQTNIAPPLELSFDVLVGKWLYLDSNGKADSSGDYLLISKEQDTYAGFLKYQNSRVKVTLMSVNKRIFVVTERGEYYLVSVVQSMYVSKHNSIGLALKVDGYDDISLGIFQHEDVLKKLEN